MSVKTCFSIFQKTLISDGACHDACRGHDRVEFRHNRSPKRPQFAQSNFQNFVIFDFSLLAGHLCNPQIVDRALRRRHGSARLGFEGVYGGGV